MSCIIIMALYKFLPSSLARSAAPRAFGRAGWRRRERWPARVGFVNGIVAALHKGASQRRYWVISLSRDTR